MPHGGLHVLALKLCHKYSNALFSVGGGFKKLSYDESDDILVTRISDK